MHAPVMRRSTRCLRPSILQGSRTHVVPFSFPLPLHFYGSDTGRLCDDFEDMRKDARDNYSAAEMVRSDGMSSMLENDRSRSFYLQHYGTTPYADITRSVSASVWGVGQKDLDGRPLWDVYPELKYIPDESSGDIPRDLANTIRKNLQHPFRKAPSTGRIWLTPVNTRIRLTAQTKSPVIGKQEINLQGTDWRTVTSSEGWYLGWKYNALDLKGKLMAKKRVAANQLEYFHRGPAYRIRMGGTVTPEIDKFFFYAGIGAEFLTYGVDDMRNPQFKSYYVIMLMIYSAAPMILWWFWSLMSERRMETASWTPASNPTWGSSVFPTYGGQNFRAKCFQWMKAGPYRQTSQMTRM